MRLRDLKVGDVVIVGPCYPIDYPVLMTGERDLRGLVVEITHIEQGVLFPIRTRVSNSADVSLLSPREVLCVVGDVRDA